MLPAQIPAPSPEIAAVANAVNDLIAGIMAKQTFEQIAATVGGDLVGAIASLQNAATDVKTPANQAYLGFALATALEPAPVVTTPAA